jgi:hypothetical protein
MKGMKRKVHYQVQPRQSVPPRLQPVPVLSVQSASQSMRHEENVQQEIDTFLQALDSYPDRAAKDRSVSFQDHLRSIFDQAHQFQNIVQKNDGRRNAAARRH